VETFAGQRFVISSTSARARRQPDGNSVTYWLVRLHAGTSGS
jgi:hypothetical protein